MILYVTKILWSVTLHGVTYIHHMMVKCILVSSRPTLQREPRSFLLALPTKARGILLCLD